MSSTSTLSRQTENQPSAPSGKGVNLNVVLACPECKVYPPELIERHSDGDIVCALCGLVLSDRVIDSRSEWRTFNNDDQNGDDPSRVGEASASVLDSDQLSTVISNAQEGGRVARELNRTQGKSVADKKDHALQTAYAKISQMCDGYQLPKVVQDGAKEVYKLVYDDKLLRGKSQESIMAAAIFLGCRKASVPRSFKEIWALTNVPRKEIGKTFKIINQIIRKKNAEQGGLITYQNDNIATTQTNPEDLVGRFCSHLGLKPQLTSSARHIARKLREVGVLEGRSPTTIAATVIYFTTILFSQQIPLQKISEKTGVSEGTIKSSYKHLCTARDELIDPTWVESGKVDPEIVPIVKLEEKVVN
ncbi:DEKNAAC102852 [Brettanomyces naardenensis]|uniref:Transcription initiation factor IIB n=1 Tax=Brettanomyces naardenensis TaxID=13370 RepID=A0A448YLX3_BRENA|nr:DEKNAAC102852 [Brettanomyces naardenensis]